MVFLYVLELAIIALVLLFFGTQIFVPIFRGTPLFPLFRSEGSKLAAELGRAREKITAEEIRFEIAAAEAEAERLHKQTIRTPGVTDETEAPKTEKTKEGVH